MAHKPIGTTDGTVAEGDDPRFPTARYDTTTNPTVNNDSADTAGIGRTFAVGDTWRNTVSGEEWRCWSAVATAANWVFEKQEFVDLCNAAAINSRWALYTTGNPLVDSITPSVDVGIVFQRLSGALALRLETPLHQGCSEVDITAYLLFGTAASSPQCVIYAGDSTEATFKLNCGLVHNTVAGNRRIRQGQLDASHADGGLGVGAWVRSSYRTGAVTAGYSVQARTVNPTFVNFTTAGGVNLNWWLASWLAGCMINPVAGAPVSWTLQYFRLYAR